MLEKPIDLFTPPSEFDAVVVPVAAGPLELDALGRHVLPLSNGWIRLAAKKWPWFLRTAAAALTYRATRPNVAHNTHQGDR